MNNAAANNPMVKMVLNAFRTCKGADMNQVKLLDLRNRMEAAGVPQGAHEAIIKFTCRSGLARLEPAEGRQRRMTAEERSACLLDGTEVMAYLAMADV